MTCRWTLSLAAAWAQLLRTWWQQDRIRVPRSCGQLLSLKSGDQLIISDGIYVVVNCMTDLASKEVYTGGDEPFMDVAGSASAAVPTHVEYELRESSDEQALGQVAHLIVPLAEQDAIRICRGPAVQELLAEDVVILNTCTRPTARCL